ncbi:A-kinase anchor protein 17A [Erinaceus europaeus]|uniref:A-kinase anchor protein 17A n=1 Tax=Erinaceus europaeus TaxID=9365 RepID=A0ABM3WRA4_ERIEU|nr:A-kinase anchor protein 17A [Erinaceus europaeus]XP_060039104.1 A-kinase anchor protein 17A [Erinaceus europaeus]XP_060039105.1 A-kinase anchor protein 17A [Erinaceus europaeus]
MAAATIVHDTSEAVELCAAHGLYLKPVARMSISVALPPLKPPGKAISNWEVMERLKAMVAQPPFSALRIAKSTMDFIRFEGELEHRGLVRAALARLDGKTIKLSGWADSLRVRAAEFKLDFPSRHDWDSFFRDARDMDEALPGERPDTIHLEGLPCRWFAPRDAPAPERPSEQVLARVFQKFGAIRHVDIPMLDPYREEMTGRNFHTFSFGGHLNFEAYVQYREYAGFIQAMSALRGMKLMFKGDDGKAVACNIKVSFDSTKHLSDASIRKRQLERQKLQELERQREEQKRREKEAEERQRAEERKQREQEEQERLRRRGERRRRREARARARAQRRSLRRQEKAQAQEQRRLQEEVRLEERKLLLAQRNLHSLRLVAELLSRAKAARLREQERREQRQRQEQRQRRRQQELELRRVEEEKRRALGLQRRERELRGRLLSLLLSKRAPDANDRAPDPDPAACAPDAPGLARAQLLQPVLDILRQTVRGRRGDPGAQGGPGVLACIPDNTPAEPRRDKDRDKDRDRDPDARDKCNREPSAERDGDPDRHPGDPGRPQKRADDRDDGDRRGRRERASPGPRARDRRSHSGDPADRGETRRHRRQRSRERGDRDEDAGDADARRRGRHRRGDRGDGDRDRSRSTSRGHRGAWNR